MSLTIKYKTAKGLIRIEFDLRSSRPNLGFIIGINKCKWIIRVYFKVLEASDYISVCIYNLPKRYPLKRS